MRVAFVGLGKPFIFTQSYASAADGSSVRVMVIQAGMKVTVSTVWMYKLGNWALSYK